MESINNSTIKTDIVIAWVDGNDGEWIKIRDQYAPNDGFGGAKRFRDWDNLQYVFRGIEKYMPWINKVHLVTMGHYPKWINPSSPKLNLVKHSDFIPEKYLPTFSANPIELNIHKIPGISEQIIYFNDDMFVIKPTNETDFFVDGKPKDMASISPQPIYRDKIINIELNNMQIINDHFSIEDIHANKKLWNRLGLYGQYAIRTKIFGKFGTILGIFQPHIPYNLLRSTLETLWDKENEVLDNTCMNRFRSKDDVNIWLARSWQLLTGNFVPRSAKFGKLVPAGNIDAVKYFLKDKKTHLICINDDDSVKDFEKNKTEINSLLEEMFPEKSSFEI